MLQYPFLNTKGPDNSNVAQMVIQIDITSENGSTNQNSENISDFYLQIRMELFIFPIQRTKRIDIMIEEYIFVQFQIIYRRTAER